MLRDSFEILTVLAELTRRVNVQDKDGFLTAEDLQTALGRTQDVKQLIAAADTNNDGNCHLTHFNGNS